LLRDSETQQATSGIMDARKIYPAYLKDMGRWRPWTERVLRWARMQSADLHAALPQALKSHSAPVSHDCSDELVLFWAHLEDRIKEPEAAGIVKMVRGDDGVEAFRQLNNRFDPQTALTKSHRLKAIQKFPGKNGVKKNVDVPAVLARFEDLLIKYYEDYESEALSDDLKKEALKELIPPALAQTVEDVIMFRNMNVDTLSAAQVKTLVMERIAGDVQDQVIGMSVGQVESHKPAPQQLPAQEAEWTKAEWANSQGYGPQQGAIGKNGKGKGKDEKGKGEGTDWSKGGQAGAGKGEHPGGACSF